MRKTSYSQEEILSLIREIQTAPTEPGAWDAVLQSVGEMTNSHIGAFYNLDMGSGTANFLAYRGVSPEDGKAYEDYYAAKSITHQVSTTFTPGSVYSDNMHSDPTVFRNCEAYNDYFKRYEAEHAMLVHLRNDDEMKTPFAVRRNKKYGHYEDGEIDLFKLIYPFLRQSFEVGNKLQKLQGLENSLHVMMNQVPYGVVFVDGRGQMLVANQVAENIFADNDGLTLNRQGKCIAASSQENQKLSLVIDQVVQAGLGLGIHSGCAMAVSRPSTKPSYGLKIFPIPMDSRLFNRLRPAAGIFIADPDSNQQPPHKILGELFGFTLAEERMARLLMQGCSIKDCAEQMEIAESTARYYSKVVFSKAGVSRQGELIQLLFSSTLSMLKID